MAIRENGKRVTARGITFIDDKILIIERYRLVNGEMLHYFTIPGGGVEEGETYEEACIRETKEETSCNVEIIKFLEKEEYDEGIVYWYLTKYLSGKPELGGEELEYNNPENSYKLCLIPMKDIFNINILGEGKRLAIEAYLSFRR